MFFIFFFIFFLQAVSVRQNCCRCFSVILFFCYFFLGEVEEDEEEEQKEDEEEEAEVNRKRKRGNGENRKLAKNRKLEPGEARRRANYD